MTFDPTKQYGDYVPCTDKDIKEAEELMRELAQHFVPEELWGEIKYFESVYIDPETYLEVPCYCWKYTPKKEVAKA